MIDLFNIVAEMAFELPPERLDFIAVQAEKMQTSINISKLKKAWGVNTDSALFERFFANVEKTHISGTELATAIRSATATSCYSTKQGQVELLWTGPETSAVPLRYTEQALCELINAAQRKLFIVSFVAYKADAVINALNSAILRNVEVNFLLEKSKNFGGSVDIDSMQNLKNQLPGAKFYTWFTKNEPNLAVVHAKCAVADDKFALITSANLTGKAMSDNMELGVMLRKGNLPRQLHKHFEALITENIITIEE